MNQQIDNALGGFMGDASKEGGSASNSASAVHPSPTTPSKETIDSIIEAILTEYHRTWLSLECQRDAMRKAATAAVMQSKEVMGLRAENRLLREQMKPLVEALRFYAHKGTYEAQSFVSLCAAIDRDKGDYARQALATIEQQEEK